MRYLEIPIRRPQVKDLLRLSPIFLEVIQKRICVYDFGIRCGQKVLV